MQQYVIERTIPGASTLTEDELAEIAAKSNEVCDALETPYRWVHSYVAGDKFYCIHESDSLDAIREHARRGGFPMDLISPVAAVISPESAPGSTDAAAPGR